MKIKSEFEFFIVLFANITEKFIGLLLLFGLSRLLTQEELGWFTAGKALYSVFLPLSGFGLAYSYLYYSASNPNSEKQFFHTAYSSGLLSCVCIGGLMFLAGSYHLPGVDGKLFLVGILSLQIFVAFLTDLFRSRDRLLLRNIRYAGTGLLISASTFCSTIIGAYWWGLYGAIVMGWAGLIVTLPFIWRPLSPAHDRLSPEIKRKFWGYGLSVGSGSLVNQFLVSIDVLMLTFLGVPLQEIAIYKIGSALILQLLAVPNSYFAWRFVPLVKAVRFSVLLKSELYRYYIWAVPITIIVAVVVWVFSERIIVFFFEEQYGVASKVQVLLIAPFIIGSLLRIPFGNLINAIGRAGANSILAYAFAPLAIVLNYYMIQKFGVIGAGYAAAVFSIISGIASVLVFLRLRIR